MPQTSIYKRNRGYNFVERTIRVFNSKLSSSTRTTNHDNFQLGNTQHPPITHINRSDTRVSVYPSSILRSIETTTHTHPAPTKPQTGPHTNSVRQSGHKDLLEVLNHVYRHMLWNILWQVLHWRVGRCLTPLRSSTSE